MSNHKGKKPTEQILMPVDFGDQEYALLWQAINAVNVPGSAVDVFKTMRDKLKARMEILATKYPAANRARDLPEDES